MNEVHKQCTQLLKDYLDNKMTIEQFLEGIHKIEQSLIPEGKHKEIADMFKGKADYLQEWEDKEQQ